MLNKINYNDLIFEKKECTLADHIISLIKLPYNTNLNTTLSENFKVENIYNERTVYFRLRRFPDLYFKILSVNSVNIEKIQLTNGYFNNIQTIKINEDFILPIVNFPFSGIFLKLTFNSKENIPEEININFEVGYFQNNIRKLSMESEIIFPKQNFEYKNGEILKHNILENVYTVFCKNKYVLPNEYYYRFLDTYDLEIEIKFGNSNSIFTNLKKLENKIIRNISPFHEVAISAENNFNLKFIPYHEDYKVKSLDICGFNIKRCKETGDFILNKTS